MSQMRHTDDMKQGNDRGLLSVICHIAHVNPVAVYVGFILLVNPYETSRWIIGVAWDVKDHVENDGNHSLYRLRPNKHLFTYHHAIPNDGIVISVVF